ncbi:LysR family transcriptional regulator [Microbacterium halotolerans]|uniref:LysR family transcriptional regulator n=1 Tax=Microbacterium halotolerans TaxID=246613 RepID=UPI001969915C|nr:LysR family transcriptional regulator [Microbacterium halotolerans]
MSTLDLNLLRVFIAVYEARSLTGAARVMHVTQPAISQSLARLRRDLADDLFFREARRMLPTPFAEELYPSIRESLERIDGAVATRGFDPASSRRRFRMALSELGELHWFDDIAAALMGAGPLIALETEALDHATIADRLTRGAVDLAINSAPIPGDFETHTIKVEQYVALMSRSHPLATRRLDFDAYRTADHVAVVRDSGRPNVENALHALGGIPQARFSVNHFSTLPTLLERGTLVATTPRSLAEAWSASQSLVYRALPFPIAPVEVKLYARTAHSDAPALRWFQDTVLAAIRNGQQNILAPALPRSP